jgi:hypothetical protein
MIMGMAVRIELPFGAYEAALDEEERSSQVYADLVQRVVSSLVIDHEHDRPSWRALFARVRPPHH